MGKLMVSANWLVVLLAAAGLAAGQQPAGPPPGPGAAAPGAVGTLVEAGQPPRRCAVLKGWRLADGARVYQVRDLDTGAVATVREVGGPPAAPGTLVGE